MCAPAPCLQTGPLCSRLHPLHPPWIPCDGLPAGATPHITCDSASSSTSDTTTPLPDRRPPARQLLLQPPPPPPASVGASSASNIFAASGGGGSPNARRPGADATHGESEASTISEAVATSAVPSEGVSVVGAIKAGGDGGGDGGGGRGDSGDGSRTAPGAAAPPAAVLRPPQMLLPSVAPVPRGSYRRCCGCFRRRCCRQRAPSRTLFKVVAARLPLRPPRLTGRAADAVAATAVDARRGDGGGTRRGNKEQAKADSRSARPRRRMRPRPPPPSPPPPLSLTTPHVPPTPPPIHIL